MFVFLEIPPTNILQSFGDSAELMIVPSVGCFIWNPPVEKVLNLKPKSLTFLDFDWSVAEHWRLGRPFVLASGIRPTYL